MPTRTRSVRDKRASSRSRRVERRTSPAHGLGVLSPTLYTCGMKLLKSAAVIGLAKKAYTEAQKPENQRRIREAVDKVKAKRNQRKSR